MPKKPDVDEIEPAFQQGEVIERMPQGLYRVKIADGITLVCHSNWRGRRMPSKEIWPHQVGTFVPVEVLPLDPTRGRINTSLMEQLYQAKKRREYQKKYRLRKILSKVKKEN